MIRKSIKEGNTKEANNMIFEFINSIKEIENDSIHSLNRINNLESKDLKGLIDHREKSVVINQLTMTTLYTCQEIEKVILKYFSSINFGSATISIEEQLSSKVRTKYESIEKIIDGSRAAFFLSEEI